MVFQDYPLLVRGSLVLAVVTAALAAGCQQPQTTRPPAVQATNGATAQPDAGSDAGANPDTLPAASLDSDLEIEDQAAIEDLLDSEALEAYLPSDLINDGGVILYRTMALRDETRDKERDTTVVTTTQTGADAETPAEPPARWARQEVKRGGREANLRRQPGEGKATKRAQVVIRYRMSGKLVFADATAKGGVRRKAFGQQFERTLRFGLENGRWGLVDFSPVKMESQGGHSGLDIGSFQVFKGDSTTPLLSVTQLDRFLTPAEVPTFQPADALRAEVTLQSRKGRDAFMFAHILGTNDRAKQMLRDDGLAGDRVAGDGIYTGTFVVPSGAGIRHFGIDVIDPITFTPGGLYRSNALGLTFKVEGP